MFVAVVDDRVLVRLSRRNLRQLDDMLEERDVRNRWLVRMDENGVALVVQVEEDADHYEGRDPGPGKFASRTAPAGGPAAGTQHASVEAGFPGRW